MEGSAKAHYILVNARYICMYATVLITTIVIPVILVPQDFLALSFNQEYILEKSGRLFPTLTSITTLILFLEIN